MYPARQPLGARAGFKQALMESVIRCVPGWLPSSSSLAFNGLVDDIKTLFQT